MNNTSYTYELIPQDGRKSFYGKAKVELAPTGTVNLYSYGTCVAFIHKGNFYRVWHGYSATTMRHINSFRMVYGNEDSKRPLSKADWCRLPLAYDYIGGDNELHIAYR